MQDLAKWVALVAFGASAMFFFLVVAAFVMTAMRNSPADHAPVAPAADDKTGDDVP